MSYRKKSRGWSILHATTLVLVYTIILMLIQVAYLVMLINFMKIQGVNIP